MRTAVDSSALLSILKGETLAHPWLELLVEARGAGELIICEIVFAEIAPLTSSVTELNEVLEDLGVRLVSTPAEAAWRAGQVFRKYRKSGGPRGHLLPDFLIAAHAEVLADRIAATDRGYLRRYFPSLRIISPQ